MTVTTTTHLNFRGDARAALEFYRSVFGGDLAIFTYADAQRVEDPAESDRVLWGQVRTEDGFSVMAYDVPGRLPWDRGENSFFVSVRGTSTDEITDHWKRLAEGATVVEELAPSPWAPLYGMLRDRFGVVWVLDVVAEYTG
ncbi:VOC family protein [Motilibacter aurantiacus]|uniref:VOC family protein n=1 Tax=Motilibacter aurantiacus TaxID=2714955 RepID=UPI001407D6BF|nr:VOC family protein [Motilibacter aurantiacus]NHC47650.1 VOC family protein [Motilibacter aurantiacus]